MTRVALLLGFLVAACATGYQDPPPFEDVEVDVAGTQEEGFDALHQQFGSDPAFTIEQEHRPDSIRVRRGGDPAFEVHVDHHHSVISGSASSPAGPVATVVRVRRNVLTSQAAEVRRWITLALGQRVRGAFRTTPVHDPHTVERVAAYHPAAPASTYRSSTPSSGGGTVHVRGHYRKDGTYVRPHTRRR